jgi:hypothetical protein
MKSALAGQGPQDSRTPVVCDRLHSELSHLTKWRSAGSSVHSRLVRGSRGNHPRGGITLKGAHNQGKQRSSRAS